MILNPPETAPRDGTMILGDFGWPWLVLAAWNAHDEQWVLALMQACPMTSGKIDVWFENERETADSLLAWVAIPKK